MNPAAIPPKVAEYLRAGNKITAIKELRAATGLGLKEARDWIDNYERGMATPLPAAEPPLGRVTTRFDISREAIDALKSGNKIGAIKMVREATGLGLAEAKAVVELLEGGEAMKNPELLKSLLDPGSAKPAPGTGLAPGEVPRSGGVGKWVALLAVAAIAVVAALYF